MILVLASSNFIRNRNNKVSQKFPQADSSLKPIRTGGGEGGINPPPTVFCLYSNNLLDDPYLKFLDFSQLLVADTAMKFFVQSVMFTPPDSTFETPSTKIFLYFLLNQKNLCEIIFRYHNKYF